MTGEMVCGIEIHQQLDTCKLFCSCDSRLSDEGEGAVYRRLRPTTSEMGEVDRAALAQFRRNLGYRYQTAPGASCLVELDEEPPHRANDEAMETVLMFSEMLGSRTVDEIHFMRKIVVDGSNTSGFQRTALVSTGGAVEVGGRSISILSVCLEEDAARKVDAKAGEVTYRLDRLGIPLIEVATGPDIRTPEEAMEVAQRIGTLLRATKRVKRGIGTIREDLNISIPGGARIEIKGVQELRLLPLYVRNEVERQRMLLRVKGILEARGVREAPFEPVDVTDVLEGCGSKVLRGALSAGGRVLAVRLPGFAGVMNGDGGTLRLGAEMAQRARARGVRGIFHSDELSFSVGEGCQPAYGIAPSFVNALAERLGMAGEHDAFAICAADAATAEAALSAAVDRANEALLRVPEETRDPLPDGTSKYSRPLPGAARMYPETDVPPIPVPAERLERIRAELPELPEVTEGRLVERCGVNAQQARQIVHRGCAELFERISSELSLAAAAATAFLNTYGEMEREGLDPHSVPDAEVLSAFRMLSESRFSKEAMPALLREMASGASAEDAVRRLGLESVGEGEAEAVIASIVAERADFVRSKGAAAVGPLMGPVMGALRGRIDGRRANELLSKEIAKLLG